jgi:hypothetical protein
MNKRSITNKSKLTLEDVRKLKNQYIRLLAKTETLKEYNKLIKDFHETTALETELKNLFKTGLRRNI